MTNTRDQWAELDAARHAERLIASYKSRPAMLAALAANLQKNAPKPAQLSEAERIARLDALLNEADSHE